jgi:hypothetical protein
MINSECCCFSAEDRINFAQTISINLVKIRSPRHHKSYTQANRPAFAECITQPMLSRLKPSLQDKPMVAGGPRHWGTTGSHYCRAFHSPDPFHCDNRGGRAAPGIGTPEWSAPDRRDEPVNSRGDLERRALRMHRPPHLFRGFSQLIKSRQRRVETQS